LVKGLWNALNILGVAGVISGIFFLKKQKKFFLL